MPIARVPYYVKWFKTHHRQIERLKKYIYPIPVASLRRMTAVELRKLLFLRVKIRELMSSHDYQSGDVRRMPLIKQELLKQHAIWNKQDDYKRSIAFYERNS